MLHAGDTAPGSVWRVRDVLVAGLVSAAASLLVYHRGLTFPFSLDDYTYLYPAAGIDPGEFSLRRLLGTTVYYKLGYVLFGVDSPTPWHAFNWLFHWANGVWVYAFARRFGARRDTAWLASGLFAVSPVAFTVLYWVACAQELTSTFFVLAAMWVALRTDRWRWASVALFAAAVLCKESVLAAPLVLPLLCGRRVLRLAAVQLVVGAVLFVGSGLHERMLVSDDAMPYATNYGYGAFVNLATAIAWLLSPWRAYTDQRSQGDFDLLPWAAGIVLFAVVGYLIGRSRPTVRSLTAPTLLATAWFVALLVPVLPLFQHFFAYYLYAPQIGFNILTAVVVLGGTSRLMRAGKHAAQSASSGRRPIALRAGAWALALAVCILFAYRNARTHETLTLPNSKILHDSVLRYGTVGGTLLRELRQADLPPTTRRVGVLYVEPEEERRGPTVGELRPGAYRIRKIPIQAVLREDKFFRLHFPDLREGRMVTSISRDHEDDTVFFVAQGQASLQRVPDLATAYTIVAYAHLLQDRYDEAEQHVTRSIQLGMRDATAYLVVAGVAAARGRIDEAQRIVESVRSQDSEGTLAQMISSIQRIIDEYRRGG